MKLVHLLARSGFFLITAVTGFGFSGILLVSKFSLAKSVSLEKGHAKYHRSSQWKAQGR